MWKPKFLRARGQEMLETWDIPIVVAQFLPQLLSVIPGHYAYAAERIVLGNTQPNPQDQCQGARPANGGRPHWLQRGFHDPPTMLRLFREFESTS